MFGYMTLISAGQKLRSLTKLFEMIYSFHLSIKGSLSLRSVCSSGMPFVIFPKTHDPN